MARKRKHPRRGRRKKRAPLVAISAPPAMTVSALPIAEPTRMQQAVSLRHLLTLANRHHA